MGETGFTEIMVMITGMTVKGGIQSRERAITHVAIFGTRWPCFVKYFIRNHIKDFQRMVYAVQ